MMADFVAPRHNAVMERLRRRIELFRRHHNSCENRYGSTGVERLELERQQTYALHQRCLQTKAKRSNKHRQPQPTGDQVAQRAPGNGSSNAELGEGVTAGEQSRNSTLIALQETVKKKLESAGSPLAREQLNGFSDAFPPSKKACLDNGHPKSPLDSKLGIGESLASNGSHGGGVEPGEGGAGEQDFRLKEMKQEPDDILPCMLPSGGGASGSLFPDLNLDEQVWSELMEEFNCSMPYEDIQDILNDGFDDRKDTPDLSAPGPVLSSSSSGARPPSQPLLPELSSVKAEFSPVFEDSHTSPRVRPTSSAPRPLPASSPIAASSPAVPQQGPPPNRLLPPGPSKDLSPAQQLQQLAAQQQRQHLHSQLQHKQQQQQQAKFHAQGPHAQGPHAQGPHAQGPHPHAPSWPQAPAPTQSSPLYAQDFNPNAPKQLLMAAQPSKGSPKAGGGGYLQGPGAHPNMLAHPASGAPLSHQPAGGGQGPTSMLSYNNTKPLSHFEAAGPAGPPRGPPNAQSQNKAALLSLLRQQEQLKHKPGMAYRPHLQHTQQDQNPYPPPPHGPGPTNTMATQPGSVMAVNPGNGAYLSSQAAVAAALKQHQQQQQQQILEQQRQLLQRQMMAEQEKQRQDQQLQRHLTRPPPQYQDQSGPSANQNPFQQQVSQFNASSQPMGNVSSMGGPASTTQRMFTQNQGMMGMNLRQGGGAGGAAPPPAASQADISLPSCGGGGGLDQVLYNNMNMHPPHQSQQAGLQRQLGPMSATYRHNLMAQQHLKSQPNAAMLKQQQLTAARMPGAMATSLGTNMASSVPSSMPGSLQTQGPAWQPQGLQGPSSSNGAMPPNAFPGTPNAFHMQTHLPKMPQGSAPFVSQPGARPLGGLGAQQMLQPSMRGPTSQQPQTQNLLSDLGAFGQQGNSRQALPCNQGYQVNRTPNQQQQQLFGYGNAGGAGLAGFPGESDLVDSLLKGQSTQEWMDDLDELLASHH